MLKNASRIHSLLLALVALLMTQISFAADKAIVNDNSKAKAAKTAAATKATSAPAAAKATPAAAKATPAAAKATPAAAKAAATAKTIPEVVSDPAPLPTVAKPTTKAETEAAKPNQEATATATPKTPTDANNQNKSAANTDVSDSSVKAQTVSKRVKRTRRVSKQLFRYRKNQRGLNTIRSVIRYTMTTNPTVLQKDAAARAARHDINKAVAGYLPKLDLTLGYGREAGTNVNNTFRNTALWRLNRGLTFSQLLWDGWGTVNNIYGSKSAYKSSIFQAAEQRQLSGLRAAEVYLDILRFSHLINISMQDLQVHRDTVYKVRKRVQGGAGQKADLDLADSRLAQTIATLEATRGLLLESKAIFRHVVGLAPHRLRYAPFPRIPRTLPQALAIAYSNNPSIKVAQHNLQLARYNLKVAYAAFFPRLSFDATYDVIAMPLVLGVQIMTPPVW